MFRVFIWYKNTLASLVAYVNPLLIITKLIFFFSLFLIKLQFIKKFFY